MIAEAIRSIEEMARRSRTISIDVCDEVEGGKVFVTEGGETKTFDRRLPKKRDEVDSVDDFVDYANSVGMSESGMVMVGYQAVCATADANVRRNWFKLKLCTSKRWDRIIALASEPLKMDPAGARRWLRLKMPGTGTGDMVKALSKVDFDRRGSSSSRSEHGRESLGKSVEAQVQQIEEIPEHFTARVPIWNTPGATHFVVDVDITVHIDPQNERIEFHVSEDSLSRAVFVAREQLRGELRSHLPETPIVLGTFDHE